MRAAFGGEAISRGAAAFGPPFPFPRPRPPAHWPLYSIVPLRTTPCSAPSAPESPRQPGNPGKRPRGPLPAVTTGTTFLHYQFKALPGQKYYEYVRTVTNGGTGVQGTLPRYHFYSTVDWKYEKYDVTLGNTFISSVDDQGPGGIVYEQRKLKAVPVASYLTWDLRAAYADDTPSTRIRAIKGWTVAMGVNNIANRMPPAAPQAYTDNNADVSTYSPLGRLLYVMGSVKF